jgi:alpha-tubulin suppressor-like RCC1 family protein
VAVTGGHVFAAIDAGTAHTCGITTAGLVLCWGANGAGRLGDGTTTGRLVPTAVSGSLTASQLDLGQEHSCVRTVAGSAVCWGNGQQGQLGQNATTNRLVPGGVSPP